MKYLKFGRNRPTVVINPVAIYKFNCMWNPEIMHKTPKAIWKTRVICEILQLCIKHRKPCEKPASDIKTEYHWIGFMWIGHFVHDGPDASNYDAHKGIFNIQKSTGITIIAETPYEAIVETSLVPVISGLSPQMWLKSLTIDFPNNKNYGCLAREFHNSFKFLPASPVAPKRYAPYVPRRN